MAAWKIPLAIGATLVGSFMQAKGAKEQGEGQIQQVQAETEAAQYNAVITRQEASAEEARRRRESQRQLGSIRAGRAKSGVTMEGTPLLALEESAELAEIDALSAGWAGEASARLDDRRAYYAQRSLPYVKKSTRYNVGSALLSGITSAATIGAMA